MTVSASSLNETELLVRSNFKYEKKDLILATLDKNNLGGRDLYLITLNNKE